MQADFSHCLADVCLVGNAMPHPIKILMSSEQALGAKKVKLPKIHVEARAS